MRFHGSMMSVLFAVVVASGASVSPSLAQTSTARVVGQVVDASSGAPVEGAVVELQERSSSALTDSSGRFVFDGVPEGAYSLRVDRLGYRVAIQPIAVADADIRVTVSLETAVLALSEIVVSPGRFGVMGEAAVRQQQTLTREDLETVPQVGEDVFRVLRTIPGVAVDDISTRLNVRGGMDTELLHLLDGVELYEPYHLKDFDGVFGIVDVQSIGGIELVTGGFGPEYGDKLTGVFGMTSRTPPVAGTSTAVGLSVSNVSLMSRGSFAEGRGEWLFQARRGYLDALLALTDSKDDGEELSPRYYDIFGKSQLRLGERHRVAINGLYAGDQLTFIAPEGGVRSTWSSAYGWLTWDAAFDRVSFTTLAFAGGLDRERGGSIDDPGDYRGPEQLRVDDHRDLRFVGVREDVRIELADRVFLKVGGEAKSLSADYDYDSTSRRVALLPDGSIGSVSDTVSVALAPEGEEKSLYVAARVRPFDAFTTEIGARYDEVSHSDDRSVSPRVLAALQVTDATAFRASWGRYRQSHGIHELEVGDGEIDFFPSDRAVQLAIGVEHRFDFGLSARLEAYRRDMSDQRPRFVNADREIDAFPEAEGDRLRIDPGKGLARGIEVLGAIDRGSWSWTASYALSEAKDRLDDRWVPRTLDQRHAVGLTSAYRSESPWKFSWTFQWHSGWPATPSVFYAEELSDGTVVLARGVGDLNALRLPSYHRLDFRVSRDFDVGGGVLQAYLDVFNLYNRANLRSLGFYPRVSNGTVRTIQEPGEELLPILPTIGFRWEF